MHSVEKIVTNKEKFSASHAIFSFIAYYLIIAASDFVISSLGAEFILANPQYDSETFRATTKLIGFVVGLLLGFLCVLQLVKQYVIQPFAEVGLIKCSVKWCLAAFSTGILASLFLKYFAYQDIMQMNLERKSPYQGVVEGGLLVKLFYLFVIGFCAPFIEEFLFRGVLYKGFAQSCGKVASAIVVTLLFIFVHTTIIQSGSWLVIGILIVCSVFLVASREISGSLIPPIIIHQSYNLGLILG